MKLKCFVMTTLLFLTSNSMAEPLVEDRLRAIESRLDAIELLLSASSKLKKSSVVSNKGPLIQVLITNKRYQKIGYEDGIWWDATYTANGLKAPARAIKGVLVFGDLFKEPIFKIQVTIDDPISPKGVVTDEGVGFNYNQFKDTHKWMRSTDLNDMKVWFEVNSILYSDGSTENFRK